MCRADKETGIVEKQTCPVGFRCSRDAVEPERCANKISDPATGKCVSCDDKHFANTATNECMQCPQNADGKILTGVECKSGRIGIEKDFFVEGSGASVAVPLSATLYVLKCRGTGVCASTVNKTDFTVQTTCIAPAAGALCGACLSEPALDPTFPIQRHSSKEDKEGSSHGRRP